MKWFVVPLVGSLIWRIHQCRFEKQIVHYIHVIIMQCSNYTITTIYVAVVKIKMKISFW